jgi:hypothetical protein
VAVARAGPAHPVVPGPHQDEGQGGAGRVGVARQRARHGGAIGAHHRLARDALPVAGRRRRSGPVEQGFDQRQGGRLGRLGAAVAVGHREQRAVLAHREGRRILVGVPMGVRFARAALGQRDRSGAVGDAGDTSDAEVLSAPQHPRLHRRTG